jgi:exocyst complex protein 7
VIEALLVDIEIKAKGYKKSVFSSVFLLNNYHYILKSIRASELSDVVEEPVLAQISKLLSKQMDIYKST